VKKKKKKNTGRRGREVQSHLCITNPLSFGFACSHHCFCGGWSTVSDHNAIYSLYTRATDSAFFLFFSSSSSSSFSSSSSYPHYSLCHLHSIAFASNNQRFGGDATRGVFDCLYDILRFTPRLPLLIDPNYRLQDHEVVEQLKGPGFIRALPGYIRGVSIE